MKTVLKESVDNIHRQTSNISLNSGSHVSLSSLGREESRDFTYKEGPPSDVDLEPPPDLRSDLSAALMSGAFAGLGRGSQVGAEES